MTAELVCETCRQAFELKRYGPRRGVRYCGRPCKDRAYRRARPSVHVPLPRSGKNCAHCGVTFEGTPGRRFCSKRCGVAFHRKAHRSRTRATQKETV